MGNRLTDEQYDLLRQRWEAGDKEKVSVVLGKLTSDEVNYFKSLLERRKDGKKLAERRWHPSRFIKEESSEPHPTGDIPPPPSIVEQAVKRKARLEEAQSLDFGQLASGEPVGQYFPTTEGMVQHAGGRPAGSGTTMERPAYTQWEDPADVPAEVAITQTAKGPPSLAAGLHALGTTPTQLAAAAPPVKEEPPNIVFLEALAELSPEERKSVENFLVKSTIQQQKNLDRWYEGMGEPEHMYTPEWVELKRANLSIRVPVDEPFLFDVIRKILKGAGTVAGFAEAPVQIPYQAIEATVHRLRTGDPSKAHELIHGVLDFPKMVTDIFMDSPKFVERFEDDPVGTLSALGLVGLGGLKVGPRMRSLELKKADLIAEFEANYKLVQQERIKQKKAYRKEAEAELVRRIEEGTVEEATQQFREANALYEEAAYCEAQTRKGRDPEIAAMEEASAEVKQLGETEVIARRALTDKLERQGMDPVEIIDKVVAEERAVLQKRIKSGESPGFKGPEELGTPENVLTDIPERRINPERTSFEALVEKVEKSKSPKDLKELQQELFKAKEAHGLEDFNLNPRLEGIHNRMMELEAEVMRAREAKQASRNESVNTTKTTADVLEKGEPLKTDATDLLDNPETSARMSMVANAIWGAENLTMRGLDFLNAVVDGAYQLWDTELYTAPQIMTKIKQVTQDFSTKVTAKIMAKRSGYMQTKEFWELEGLPILEQGTHPKGWRGLSPKNIKRRWGADKRRAQTVKERSRKVIRIIWENRRRQMEARRGEFEARIPEIQKEIAELKTKGETAEVLQQIEDLSMEFYDLTTMKEVNIPKLDPLLEQAWMRDPAIKEFIEWWDNRLYPIVEQLTQRTGKIHTRLDPHLYALLRPKHPREAHTIDMQVGDISPLQRRRMWGGGTSTGQHSPYSARPARPKSSRRATGHIPEGKFLEEDLFTLIQDTLTDRMTTIAKNELRAELAKNAITTARKLKPNQLPPFETTIGKRRVSVEGITMETGRAPKRDSTDNVYYVAKPYADLYRRAIEKETRQTMKALDAWSRMATVQVILLPAEAVRHGWNFIQAVARVEWMRDKGHGWRTVEAMGGLPFKMAVAMKRAWELSGPEFAKRLRMVGDAGALRLSGFQHTIEQQSLAQVLMTRPGGKYNPAAKLKDYVFGYPGFNKGLKGLESRYRVAIDMAMEKARPELTYIERGQLLNDGLGTYTSELLPHLTRAMQTVYPFARARVGLTKSGFFTVFGVDMARSKRKFLGSVNPYIHAANISTIGQIILANVLLDKEHRLPWEIPGWQPGSVILFETEDGRKVSIGFDLLFNPAHRFLQTTGLKNVLNSSLRGHRNPDVIISEWQRGMFNHALSWSGPGLAAFGTLLTGRAPYMTASGELLPLEEKTMSGAEYSKIKARMKAFYKQLLPVLAKGHEWAENHGYKARPQEEPWNTLFTISEYLGVAPHIGTPLEEERVKASPYFMYAREARDVAFDAVRRVINITSDRDEQIEWLNKYINTHTNPNVIVVDPFDRTSRYKPANRYAFELAIKMLTGQEKRYGRGSALEKARERREDARMKSEPQ